MSKCWNWGLIGPGRFAREFAAELTKFETANLYAVASRSEERASAFATEFGINRIYTDYGDLVSDPRVDIVYIVLPHTFHSSISKLALDSGKAVLCEKPLTPTAQETIQLVDHAQRSNTFLMEAMKTAFLPAVQQAKTWIDEGAIGSVKMAKADFCFKGSTQPEDRLMNPELAGGAILDVGIYPLYLARFLLGDIETIHASGLIAETGVEESASILCRHVSGAASTLNCSFNCEESMDATIFGSQGAIHIPKFHAASGAQLIREGEIVATSSHPHCGMVSGEIEAVHRSLARGLTECTQHSWKDSICLAEVMDEVRRQVGTFAISE